MSIDQNKPASEKAKSAAEISAEEATEKARAARDAEAAAAANTPATSTSAAPAAATTASDKKKAPATKPAPAKVAPSKDEEDDEDEDDEDEDEDDEDEDNEDEDDDDDDLPAVFNSKEAFGAFSTIINFVRPYVTMKYKKPVILIGAGILVETAFNVAFPLSLKYLIDEALQKDDISTLWIILGTLGILGVLVSIVIILYERVNAELASNVIADIKTKLFDHLQNLSAGFYSKNKTGEVMSRFGVDMSAIDECVTHAAAWGILPLLELVAGIALLFFLSWELGFVALLLIPVALIGPRIFAPKAVDASYNEKKAEAGIMATVQENVSAQLVVKAFSLRNISKSWFHERNMVARDRGIRMRFFTSLVERSVTIAVLLLHLVVFGLGAYMTFHEQISLGTFIAFESVFWELSYNIGHVTQYIPILIQGSGASHHVSDLLKEPIRVGEPENPLEMPRHQTDIRLENVTFSYDGNGKQLDNVSLHIPFGKRIAIVGASGSGKSTILSLILRLYDPNGGKISFDGMDIATASRESLRAHMAVVFQDNLLFNISIRENIRLGNPRASDADVEAAAKAAEIHKFIKTMPQGYDTIVGERGNMMSGGQRQRVAIARAIVRNPAILLLDEATSALDHSTERAINKTLKKVSQGRTMITVTHRLASVTDLDTIVVIDKGRIVEQGSHAELIANKKTYANLWEKAAHIED